MPDQANPQPKVMYDLNTVAARISWVMLLRLLIVSTLLGATIFLNRSSGEIAASSTQFLFGLIIVTYFLSICYAVWFRIGKRLQLLAHIQFFLDSLMFAAILYATGGISSGFSFLYHLWVIVAAVAMGRKFAYWQATLSILVLSVVTIMLSVSYLRPLSDQVVPGISMGTTVYFLLVNSFSLYLVAALVNVLIRRLEKAGMDLEEAGEEMAVLEQQLAQAERLAALGELAATLAHEIRNPLSAVSGSFQMLRGSHGDNKEDMPLYDIVDRELGRMGRMVDDILEFTRPGEIQPQRVDLSRMTAEVLQLFRNGNPQLKVHSDCENEVICNADVGLLKQVLWNLLVNAAQASGEDGEISVSCGQASQDMCFLRVADTGDGVAEELQQKIFEAFFSTKERGMGLGLALCKRIVDAHKGRIGVSNRETGGAVFELSIPSLSLSK